MSTFAVASVREELPVTRRTAYLNAGTFGPLPRRAAAAMAARASRDLDAGRGGSHYFPEVIAALDGARLALAGLLGVQPADVALTRSTTDACHIVVKGLRLTGDDEIVTTDAEHFGLLGPIGASPARVRVASVERRSADEAFSAIAALVGPRTRLIAVSHVCWSTGDRIPVERLPRLGVPVLVDGAQSAGAIAVDVGALGCDFYTVSGQKWLLGPELTGALYVSPAALERLAVALPTYLSQDGYAADGSFDPLPDAARFDPSWMATAGLEGLTASLAWIAELGDEARRHAHAMAARCHDMVAERAEPVTRRGESTLVTFAPRHPVDDVMARMAEQDVVVRAIPGKGWLRASVGFWTDEADLERMVTLL